LNNRKPMIAMMLALVLVLLAAATLAEGTALPAYVYPFADEDPVGAAVVDYMLNNDFGFTIEEGGVLIPTPVILDQYQRVAVVEYVKANQLDIEAYQDYGSDPVSVTD